MVNRTILTLKILKEGLMTFQRLRSLKLVKESEPADERITQMREKMVEEQSVAWAKVLEKLAISDEDIVEI